MTFYIRKNHIGLSMYKTCDKPQNDFVNSNINNHKREMNNILK